MRVILLEDLPKLGKVGDIADVAPGYARNYLLPKRYAVTVTKGTLRQIENIKMMKASREEKQLFKFRELAEKLSGVSIDIPVEIGDEEKIYGTISTNMIVDALNEKGFEINRKQVELETPIKTLGVYNVTIRLHETIEPKIRVWVVRK